MNLTIFFDPLDEDFLELSQNAHQFGSMVIPHLFSGFPDWKEAEIALIGLQDYRGEGNGQTCSMSADRIRQQLYSLSRSTSFLSIADLGNLRPGHDMAETRYRLREVCGMLLQENIIPVIIGGSNDLAYGQLLGYESLGFPVEWVNVDAKLDHDNNPRVPFHDRFLKEIFDKEQHLLLHYQHLGHQSYLTPQHTLSDLSEQNACSFMRLGEMNADFGTVEPTLRKADIFTMDINAIRTSDNPANPIQMPFGMTSEEAVKLCMYAGMSSSISSAGFYGYKYLQDNGLVSANLQAVMLWHFVEGYLQRPIGQTLTENEYDCFDVNFDSEPKLIRFFRHKVYEDRWWLRTVTESFGTLDIPCLERDYLDAVGGSIPDAWLNALKKYAYL